MLSLRFSNYKRGSAQVTLFAGGVVLGCALAYAYHRHTKEQERVSQKYPVEKLVAVVKEFKKEFYVVFRSLAMSSIKLQSQNKAKFDLPLGQLKSTLASLLTDKNSEFALQVLEIEDRVYSKHKVDNRKEFERLCCAVASFNPQLKGLMDGVKEEFQSALLGTPKPIDIPLPSAYTPEAVLEVYKNITKSILHVFIRFVKEYIDEHGSISLAEEDFNTAIKDLKIDQLKTEIIAQAGLDVLDDLHPQQVFSAAVNKYSSDHPSFSQNRTMVEKLNQELMRRLFAPHIDVESLTCELENFDQVTNPSLSSMRNGQLNNDSTTKADKFSGRNASFVLNVDDHLSFEKSVNHDSFVETATYKKYSEAISIIDDGKVSRMEALVPKLDSESLKETKESNIEAPDGLGAKNQDSHILLESAIGDQDLEGKFWHVGNAVGQ